MRLGTATRFQIEDALEQVHTCMPGKVVAYDGTLALATVDPIGVDADGSPLPRLFRVPVQHPQWGDFCIVGPLVAGDRVLLLFCETSTDESVETGQGVTPLDPRRHSLSDPVALPGFTTRPDPPSLASTGSMLRVGTANGFIDIQANGQFRVKRGSDELFSVLHAAFEALIIATAGGNPLDGATVTALEAARDALDSLGADVV